MKRPQRKSTLNFETMESRCLLSGGTPVLTTATYEKLVKDLKTAVSSAAATNDHHALDGSLERLVHRVPHGKRQLLPIWKADAQSAPLNSASDVQTLQDELVITLQDDIHDDVVLGLLRVKGFGIPSRSGLGSPSALPPQFVTGPQFYVSGTNFLSFKSAYPSFTLGTQSLGGGVTLTINTVADTKSPGDPVWIDMDFENSGTSDTLAYNANNPWGVGFTTAYESGGIQLSENIHLYSELCYFTVDGTAVAPGPSADGLYGSANPNVFERSIVPNVYFFTSFNYISPNQTSGDVLKLGNVIQTGVPYSKFLSDLGLPSDVNGVHFDFLAY